MARAGEAANTARKAIAALRILKPTQKYVEVDHAPWVKQGQSGHFFDGRIYARAKYPDSL